MTYDTFLGRFEYLRLNGHVAHETFGPYRHVNQTFYRSNEWYRVRDAVIYRDNGCDLGILGREIHTELLVHHMTPMTVDDILHHEEWILDPEYLITVSKDTHNAIHYGRDLRAPEVVTERSRGDTKLW
jgi:hypothetical protein